MAREDARRFFDYCDLVTGQKCGEGTGHKTVTVEMTGRRVLARGRPARCLIGKTLKFLQL